MTAKNQLRIFLITVLFLMSCGAKSAPTIIRCVAGPNFAGHVHLVPCLGQPSGSVLLDDNGKTTTSACPADDNVEIVLDRNGKTTYILPGQVHIDRTGDGIAVSIDAVVK